MEKYKCDDCGHIFEGDLSTMQCPSCGSNEIKKVKSTNIPWKYVGIAVAAIGVIFAIFAISGGEDKLEASLQERNDMIVIEVDGVSASKLEKDYKVVVYNQYNKEHGSVAFFKTKRIAQYSTSYMLEGQCYTFNIERKDGASVKNLIWKSSNEYCVPINPIKPEIDHIEPGDADHVNLVWNNIKVVMKIEGKFSYSIIDGQFQSSPIFNNIKPGSYIVVVKNAEGVTVSQPILLNKIEKLDPPLTLQQVQDVFDRVSAGTMKIEVALKQLSNGHVSLAKKVEPDIDSLYGALFEASMGVRFKVNSFENDPNTNKIKSGTLNLRRK